MPEFGIRRVSAVATVGRMNHDRPHIFDFRSSTLLGLLFALVCLLRFTSSLAANSVTVESKLFAPGQVACTVGVFVKNDVPIQAIVVPLELRSISGGAYLKGPFPASFKFGPTPGNRIDNSPLGSAGDNWPEPIRFNQRYAAPATQTCSGPMTNTFGIATSSVDAISPDAVSYIAVSVGDPSLGEQVFMGTGNDPAGTANASFRFIFNVDTLVGCFRIDTCCCSPSNHLAMIGTDIFREPVDLPVDFVWGVVSVGTDSCPGGGNPATNNPPIAQCRDSIEVDINEGCTAIVAPYQLDNGSSDPEDGDNLYFMIDPPGPFTIGKHSVNFRVCDQDGKCSACPSIIVVRDTIAISIMVDRDSLYFHFTGNPATDTVCQIVEVTATGCGASIRHDSDVNGVLVASDFLGGTPSHHTIRVCVNPIAALLPNGNYYGEVVASLNSRPERDTVVVIVDVDHAPLEPGCDSVCGFVLSLDGLPISHARVVAYTCDSNGAHCVAAPGPLTLTDADGAFCIRTWGWTSLKLEASIFGYFHNRVSVANCDGFPTYIYIDESGPVFPGNGGAGPGIVAPCVSQGFVVSQLDGDSTSPIIGALVELWDSYPDGIRLVVDTTDSFGHFGSWQQPGTLVVKAKGYCPKVIEDFACSYSPQIVTLDPLDFVLPESPFFHDYYSTSATFEGYPILPGDVIYATDSNGIVVGLAYVTAPGTYLIHVLGNVPKDPDVVDEGAESGEFVQLWLNCHCPVTVNEGFVNFGNTQFDAAWDCRPTEMCCELCPGWSMWSYAMYLPSYARESVLTTIDLSYDAVRSGRCAESGPNTVISWFANRPVNDLSELPPWYGHDIHMTALDTICLDGEFIPANTQIPLCDGWNYIPYWPMTADTRAHALQSLAGNYTFIYNLWACGDQFDSWQSTRPEGANDLICMEPCRGYWINMISPDTLIYPTTGYECGLAQAKRLPEYSSGQVTSTPLFSDFWSIEATGLNAGDIITVRGESGHLIGECMVGEGGAFLLHVFGDVPNTPEVEGAVNGEQLSFSVNGSAASVQGVSTWNDRESNQIVVSTSGANPIPTDYALLQNYPNPFNAGTVMPFTMKNESEWTLTVYNIMGQTVRTFTGNSPAGLVRVEWNARDSNGRDVASGVYFYRVTTPVWSAERKMILMK